MLGRNSLWAAGAVVAGLMLSSPAMAQYDAHTATDLNLRVGPGTEYGIIDVIPAGYPVDVLGCLDAFEWCDIEWDGLRGWVFARYLVQPGTTVYLPQYAPRIGVPIISFSFFSYHDRYYRDRPWYRERHGRWRGRDWRDRDRDRDGRDRDRADDRDGSRDRERVREREERQEAERPRRQREAEQPRRQREAEQPRRQREAEQPRRQREAEQPRRQREAEPRQQRQREARPQQGERQSERNQRRRSGDDEEELQRRRGQ